MPRIDSVTLAEDGAEGAGTDGELRGVFGAQAVMTRKGRSQVKRRIVVASQYMCDARILQRGRSYEGSTRRHEVFEDATKLLASLKDFDAGTARSAVGGGEGKPR